MDVQSIRDMTTLSKLVAKERDLGGYTTYVFECLEERVNDSKYVMCTCFPNWQHREINIGDVGYVEFREIRAGMDKWYDGSGFIPYRYNNIQFIKFIDKPEKTDKETYII